MNRTLAIKAALVWLLIACLAILNGIVREQVMAPVIDAAAALPLSGVTLTVVVFLVTYGCFGFIGAKTRAACLSVGVQWVLMTLAFEFLFGRLVADKSWVTLWQTFNLARGDLFLLVLAASLLSPWLVAKIKAAG